MSALTEVAVLSGGKAIVCRTEDGAYRLIRPNADGDPMASDPVNVDDVVRVAAAELLGIQRHGGAVQQTVNRLALAVVALSAEREAANG